MKTFAAILLVGLAASLGLSGRPVAAAEALRSFAVPGSRGAPTRLVSDRSETVWVIMSGTQQLASFDPGR